MDLLAGYESDDENIVSSSSKQLASDAGKSGALMNPPIEEIVDEQLLQDTAQRTIEPYRHTKLPNMMSTTASTTTERFPSTVSSSNPSPQANHSSTSSSFGPPPPQPANASTDDGVDGGGSDESARRKRQKREAKDAEKASKKASKKAAKAEKKAASSSAAAGAKLVLPSAADLLSGISSTAMGIGMSGNEADSEPSSSPVSLPSGRPRYNALPPPASLIASDQLSEEEQWKMKPMNFDASKKRRFVDMPSHASSSSTSTTSSSSALPSSNSANSLHRHFAPPQVTRKQANISTEDTSNWTTQTRKRAPNSGSPTDTITTEP